MKRQKVARLHSLAEALNYPLTPKPSTPLNQALTRVVSQEAAWSCGRSIQITVNVYATNATPSQFAA